MKKKDITFIIGLTILMGVIWIIGELVMGLWIAVLPRTHIIWFAVIVAITLAISIFVGNFCFRYFMASIQ